MFCVTKPYAKSCLDSFKNYLLVSKHLCGIIKVVEEHVLPLTPWSINFGERHGYSLYFFRRTPCNAVKHRP